MKLILAKASSGLVIPAPLQTNYAVAIIPGCPSDTLLRYSHLSIFFSSKATLILSFLILFLIISVLFQLKENTINSFIQAEKFVLKIYFGIFFLFVVIFLLDALAHSNGKDVWYVAFIIPTFFVIVLTGSVITVPVTFLAYISQKKKNKRLTFLLITLVLAGGYLACYEIGMYYKKIAEPLNHYDIARCQYKRE